MRSTCPKVGETVWLPTQKLVGSPWRVERHVIKAELKQVGGGHTFLLVGEEGQFPCSALCATKAQATAAIGRWLGTA